VALRADRRGVQFFSAEIADYLNEIRVPSRASLFLELDVPMLFRSAAALAILTVALSLAPALAQLATVSAPPAAAAQPALT